MVRNRKRNDKNADGTTMKRKSQKLGLKGVLREEYRVPFMNQVFDWCHTATEICVLGSSLFLYNTNVACDDERTLNYFNLTVADGCKIIKNCFDAVLQANCRTLPAGFLEIVQRADPELNNFENWPVRSALNNALNALKTQYITNVRNNLYMHCFTRLKQFFLILQFEANMQLQDDEKITDLDVRNATKELVLGTVVQNRTPYVDYLLGYAYLIGVPHEQPFKDFVK